MTGDNRFVFVAPMYNAAPTLRRMLHSLCGQSYDNWRLELIDDVSDHDHYVRCVDIITDFTTMGYKPNINVTFNTEKK